MIQNNTSFFLEYSHSKGAWSKSSIQLNHLFSVNHYFSFRIKQELPIVYSYKFICVCIISFYANFTEIGIRS